MTINKKSTLLLGASALGIMLASTDAMAAATIQTTASTATYQAANNGDTLEVSGANGSITKTGGAAVDLNGKTGIEVLINVDSASTAAIKSTGNFSTIDSTNTASKLSKLTITKGILTGGATDGTAVVNVSGAAASQVITIAATGSITQTDATKGVVFNFDGTNGAQTPSIDNSGTLSVTGDNANSVVINVGNTAGNVLTLTNKSGAFILGTTASTKAPSSYAVKIGTSAVANITNAGTIVGNIDLGGDSTSKLTSTGTITGTITMGNVNGQTVTLSSSSSLVGGVTMGNDGNALNLSGGTISGAVNGGTVAVGADTATGAAWGGSTAIKSLTIATGKTLSTGFNLTTTATTLNGTGILKTTADSLTIAGTVDSDSSKTGALIINGSTTLSGAVGGTQAIASANVATSKTMTLADASTITATTLGSGATLTNTGMSSAKTHTGTVDGAGTVAAAASQAWTFASDIGATTGLTAITVADSATIKLNGNTTASTTTVGGGTSGTLVMNAANKTLTSNVTLKSGAALQIATGSTGVTVNGTIDGNAAGLGVLTVNESWATTKAVGSTYGLSSIAVADTKTLTANNNLSATTITLKGAGGTLKVNATGLNLVGNIEGGNAGEGILELAKDYQATTNIGATNKLAAVNVDSGINFKLHKAGYDGTTNKYQATLTTVSAGGTLDMNGKNQTISAGGLTVAAAGGGYGAGTLALGSTTLTMTNGNLNLNGAMALTLTDGTSTTGLGRVAITSGSATLGASSVITITPADYVVSGTAYKIISGSGASTVYAGASVNNTGAIIWSAPTAVGNDVVVTPTVSKFASISGVAGTAGADFAAALDGAGTPTTAAAKSLLGYYQSLSASSFVTETAKATAPLKSGGAQAAANVANAGAISNIATRLGSAGGHTMVMADAGMSDMALASSGVSAGDAAGANVELWGRLMGSHADQKNKDSINGYKTKMVGFTLGGDGLVIDGMKLGAAFSYGDAKVDEKESFSSTKAKSYIFNVYHSYSPMDTWFVDSVLGIAQHKFDRDRFEGTGFSNGKYNAMQYTAQFTGGHNIKMADGLVVTPMGTVSAGTMKDKSFTETGGINPQSFAAKTLNSFQIGLGAKVSYATRLADGWAAAPQFSVNWMHEFNSKAPTTRATMNVINYSYTASGMKQAKDIFDIGAGVALKGDNGTSVSLNYAATLKSKYVAHTGMVKVGYKF